MKIWPFASSPIKSKSAPEITATSTFFPLQFVTNFLSGSLEADEAKLLMYYLSVPELSAIINYRGRVFSQMKVRARRIDTQKDIEKHPALDLMNNPNPLQSFAEFAKQYHISRDIFGNAFHHLVYGSRPDMSKFIFNIPALNSEIHTKQDFRVPFNMTTQDEIIDYYRFWFRGYELKYKPEEIIHFAETQINYNNTLYWLKGQSKIQPLTQSLENIKTSYEARGILIGNSPMGIISASDRDMTGMSTMTDNEKLKVQNDLKKYGLRKDKWQFIVSSAKLNWVSMSSNIAGLKLFEEVDNDQSTIADAFAFPVELFQNNVTYENKKEAKKQLYQDSIIPEAEEWLQGISSSLNLLQKGIELYPDFSHIPVLQVDFESKSRMWNYTVIAASKALEDGAISPEEYKALLVKIGML